MTKKSRDDFLERTKQQIAKRAGWLCSFPTCRTPTVGATSDGEGVINIGTAAHICAAARGGPRFDEKMSPEERSSPSNGIWMCRDHGKAIDSNDPQFTVEQLREWKRQAHVESWRRVMRNEAAGGPIIDVDRQLSVRIRTAAEADLRVFRRTAKWPSTSVELTLEVEGFNEPVTARALANAVTSLDDLVLVAGPGMGKTTALFQIADGLLASSSGTPFVVPLGDWATGGASILDSILRRPAFQVISEDIFRQAAAQPGVVLLLDGWNELDAQSRARARVQVAALKAELPELGLIVSTRRQSLDVPFGGTRVDLMPLNEKQQMQIAVAMRGDAGAKIVYQARRNASIRELVTIPLYLTTLLSLPEDVPFPTTREGVLRHFVAAHEGEVSHAEALYAIAQGFQQNYLDDIAVFATRAANTAIADINARRSISETVTLLAENGQITMKSQPDAILDVLVNHHVLMRAGDSPGFSFQHQQFQEWYASHSVERRIIAEIAEPKGRVVLNAEVFNIPAWEEAVLFAVERLARGDEHQHALCGQAIVAAFEVDPILAAEMIFRSNEETWSLIALTIQALVARWHTPGKVDRALRFMLTSGRSEFLDTVWPLISSEDNQVSLKALRNCRRFRPSILGKAPEEKIKALSQRARKVLLHEMVFNSDIEGLDLACAIAKVDHDPEVQASVVEALAFRRADRHVAEVLLIAGDKTLDLVVRKSLVDEVDDEQVKNIVARARGRQAAGKMSLHDRVRTIVHTREGEDRSAELTDIIARMEMDGKRDAERHLLHEARNRYPVAVANGLLIRVLNGDTVFHGADDILASAGFVREDDALLKLALTDPARIDDRAEAAASSLGPNAVGRLLDEFFAVGSRLVVNGKHDDVANKNYHGLETRIAHVPGASLVRAVLLRSKHADSEQMARLAGVLSRHPNGETDRARPFDADSIVVIQGLVEQWGNHMLVTGDAKRWQTASIATLASHAPCVSQLPILRRLLDDNLLRYRLVREQAIASGWRQGQATDEARQPMTFEYQRAFMAIKSHETAAMMQEYLAHEQFGEIAARVLADQWFAANEPPKEKHILGGVDFSDVPEKRVVRTTDPDATSAEAEMIFAAIEPLIADCATDAQKNRGVAIGTIALRLPHGQRESTIQRLVSVAHRRARSNLLLSLVLSGETIDFDVIATGISETFEAAKAEPWILTQSDGYELKDWLRLLPFVRLPTEALALIRSMPPTYREPRFLEVVVGGLGVVRSVETEDVLFKLAEQDPRFYRDHHWRATVLKLNTESSARRIVDLAAKGALVGDGADDWHLARELGDLIDAYPDVRSHVYEFLKDGPTTGGHLLLTNAVAENPDTRGLLLLVRLENIMRRSLMGWRTVEKVITEHAPSEYWSGAYEVVPVPAVELRRDLLAMTTDGSPADAAVRCLDAIDTIRDEHGLPASEPRHPDLASGKPWPILKPNLGAQR